MFIIPRKQNEAVVIGDDIIITVIEVRGDKVRFGIDCPREVSVYRGEFYSAIRQAAKEPKP
jgi:carbon storage regulator